MFIGMLKHLRRALILTAGLSLPVAGFVRAGEPRQGPPERIRIGLITSRSGSAASSGLEFLLGARMAVSEINDQGGILLRDAGGRRLIDLVVADDQTTTEGGLDAATRLALDEKVDMVTGGFSSAVTLTSQTLFAQQGIPFLIAGASTPRVTRRTDIDTRWMFHYLEIGPYLGKSIANFLSEVLQPKVAPGGKLRVALLYQNTAFGEDFRLGLPDLGIVGWTQSQKLPLEFVIQQPFNLGQTDFSKELAAIKATDPQVILPIAFESETIDILKQGAGAAGIKALWGPAALAVDSPTYYENVGDAGRLSTIDTYFSTYETPRGQAGSRLPRFRVDFQRFTGGMPGLFAATLYDCIYILKQAVENAGSLDKNKVRQALEALDMPASVLPVEGGRIRFDANHEVRMTIFVTQLLQDPVSHLLRPIIVWPAELANGQFVLGSAQATVSH